MWTDSIAGSEPLLLLLDFDGTLVPIAEHPDGIVVPRELPELLQRLGRAGHEVWIVSGRRADDIHARVGDEVCVVGLHGLDWPGDTARPRNEKLDEVRARVERALATDPSLAGTHIEDKGLSLALHYRGVADDKRANARERLVAIASEVLAGDAALNVLLGHCVVEVRPREASKGNAVRRLVQTHPDHRPVYIGDDVTDEEAFAALGERGIGVRVASVGTDTLASVMVPDVDEVMRGLASLAASSR